VAPAGALPQGLSLAGVAGSGAIFSFADGTQRFIGRGREVVPGVTLQAVRRRDVLLAVSTTNYRLPIGGTAVAIQPPQPAAVITGPPASGTVMGGQQITDAQQQALGQQFAVALAPREAGGRITGWTIRSDVNVAPLAQAGLQPGDVLIAVNGAPVTSREQIVGLPAQIANGTRVEFEIERGGARMRRSLEPNSRR
jgi:type II secretory pathway component PulC